MIGGVVAAVLGSLVVAGVALYFWRRKKHRRDKEEHEHVNQVRKDFGRRLELEFEDDEAGNGQDVSIFAFPATLSFPCPISKFAVSQAQCRRYILFGRRATAWFD